MLVLCVTQQTNMNVRSGGNLSLPSNVVVVIQLLTLSQSWPERVGQVSHWAKKSRGSSGFRDLRDLGEEAKRGRQSGQLKVSSLDLVTALSFRPLLLKLAAGSSLCLFLPRRRLEARALESRGDVAGIHASHTELFVVCGPSRLSLIVCQFGFLPD